MTSLVRRGPDGETSAWHSEPEPDQELLPEPVPETQWLRVELPKGYIATITLTPIPPASPTDDAD